MGLQLSTQSKIQPTTTLFSFCNKALL